MAQINSGKKSERIFEKLLEDKYKKSVYIERLPDTKSVKGMTGTGFVMKRPSDYIVTLNGEMFYAEVKSVTDEPSFSFSNLRPAQRNAMARQWAAGGLYKIFIHNLLTDTWYELNAGEVFCAEATGKKSIKWKDIPLWQI